MSQALLKFNGNENFDVGPFLKAPRQNLLPYHITAVGALYAADCLDVLLLIKDEVIDTVFADPPFNIGKEYGENTDDNLPDKNYIEWCRE